MDWITVARWPNPIADTADEAIGKLIKVKSGNAEQIFSVASVVGDRLNLRCEDEPTRGTIDGPGKLVHPDR